MSKEARDVQQREGDIPHWTDSMFGGMPTTQITGSDIDTAPVVDVEGDSEGHPHRSGHHLVAMLSAYVLGLCSACRLGCRCVAGGGIWPVQFERAVPVCRPRHQGAGHRHHARRARWHGVGVPRAVWARCGVAALFAALHLAADHVQMTYYLLFLLGAVAVGAWVHAGLNGGFHESEVAKTSVVLLALAGLLSVTAANGAVGLDPAILGVHHPRDQGQLDVGRRSRTTLKTALTGTTFWNTAWQEGSGGAWPFRT